MWLSFFLYAMDGYITSVASVFINDAKNIVCVRNITQIKCFNLVVDKEEHLYYYKNKKTNKCSRTNVYLFAIGENK